MNPTIVIGSLVITNTGTKRHGEMGIVTDIIYPQDHNLWPDNLIMKVLYPHTGEELMWSEKSLGLAS